MDSLMSRLSRKEDVKIVQYSVFEDPTRTESSGIRHTPIVLESPEDKNSHAAYLVIDKSKIAPPAQNDDDVVMVFEKRVLSSAKQNDDRTENVSNYEGGHVLECSVCFKVKFEREEQHFVLTLCGHTFCSDCKENILRHSLVAIPNIAECPVCRQPIRRTSFIKIHSHPST